ncbi:MAG: tyrosine-type recombinase/integrase [Oscillospiraceae bacterium]|jgi:integrase/recombinase XerD|nr:tyrosine-type recombinase/integrase [Oscillospiraceae bacterium]
MPRTPNTRPITLKQEPSAASFAELCAEFIRFKKLRNLSPETISFYEDCGRYFADFLGEAVMCDKITEDTYYNYIEHLHETKPNLSSATERSYLTGIRAILYYGMKKGYLQDFVVQLPKIDEVVKDTYTDSEVKILLEKPDIKSASFAEYRNWVIINYMLGTGNRAGTIVSVQIEDLDFEGNIIILKKLKGRKQYVIPISRSLAAILREYLSYRKGEPGEPLFCTAYGKPMTTDILEKEIARYNRKRGVEKTSLHMFRHTFAKQWILNGGDIFRLQKILGHSSLEMVRKYVNMFSDDLQRGFDSFNPLENYLGAANKGDKLSLKGRK